MTTDTIALRAAEAMRDAAAKLAGGDTDLLRRQGHHKAADAYESAAHLIMRIDPEQIVSSLTGWAPSQDETQAFEKAAKLALFNVTRRDNGELFTPITQRVHAVWRAGVRWAQGVAGVHVARQDQAGAVVRPEVVERFVDYSKIAHLIGSIFFAGDFKAETANERELEALLVKAGHRYASWEEIETFRSDDLPVEFRAAPHQASAPPVATVVSRAGDDLRIGWLRPELCQVGTNLYLAAPTLGSAPQADELIELLKAIRPSYGDVGSRDVDVAAQQKRIDRAIELLAAGAPQAERAAVPSRVMEALTDGIPLSEPVYIGKALRAHRLAKVVLSGGSGPVAAVHLVNIGLTGWVYTKETAEAYAKGYNDALKHYRTALLEVAAPVAQEGEQSAQAAPADAVRDERVAHACWLLMQFPIHRYLMSNAHGRWDGAEKAQRHMELCKIAVAVARGLGDLEVVRQTHDADYEAVHSKTQELTDNLDEAIGFPLDTDPDYDALAPLFFALFMELADAALRTTSTPEDSQEGL